jgi:hypothetical protein
MGAFVCARCRRVERNPYRQYDERLEYRRLDARDRRAVITVRKLCVDCVDQVIAERRGVEPDVMQAGLFE